VTGPLRHVDLTPTEWKVLEALVRKPGRLVSTAELLAKFPAGAMFQAAATCVAT